ncbi:MAG TPA: transcription-repair coupling factor [Acidimicrobiia bacterium]|nr:transcription-repair coupling factor [Acidimicrobiia bacterium]
MPAPLAPLVERWRPHQLPGATGRLVVPPNGRAIFLAGLAAKAPGAVLAVVPTERDAEELAEDLELFIERAALLPAWETLPFEHVSPNVGTMARRALARHLLRRTEPGTVVVASARSVSQRVSPSPVDPVTAAPGDEVGFDRLIGGLVAAGYHRTDRVEARGEMAVRGGIIDVFPAQAEEPVRLELWGDEVDSTRVFSIASQRSIEPAPGLVAYPAREFRPEGDVVAEARRLLVTERWAAATWERLAEGLVFPGMESWLPWMTPPITVLDQLPGTARLVVFDPARAGDRSRDLVKEEEELAAALAPTWGHGAPEAGEHPALYLDLGQALEGRDMLAVPPLAAGPADERLEVRALDATPGDPESVARGLDRMMAAGTAVVVAMDGEGAADRVSRVLGDEGVVLPRRALLDEVESAVLPVGIHRGFVLPTLDVAVLGEHEIAGRRRAHRRALRRAAAVGADYRDLTPGDYVVHHRHGIGRFEGMVTRSIAGVERDYLVVAYAAGDRLYVPTDQLAAVRKYTGGEEPRVSRMGGKDWAETRARVRRTVAAVAEQVVALHRARAAAAGHAYPPDAPWQGEMESAFPFEETPDQLTTIVEVKEDMEQDRPMDRLVFGDVGYGKTEVAIRAAFKAVLGGKQVAVLVPTTLLAQQHHQTFSERFAPFPVRVEVLSRFLTQRQQKAVVDGIRRGDVDVVIGTHRVLSDDIHWKDLGLLVVDEEQRFGVNAKDAIKQLRVGVDVLTITATPIPRTLEMALTGIRDVSHIRTPPEDRHPILTYVGPYDQQAVAAAIRRELLREGQVFYVHNRVRSIDRAVAQLRVLVPDARYVVAHGQMSEGQLEQAMLDFWNRESDVMVATTIIESGLDLPQVNTLIVERADLLGLAQLYQLRGRVGRSSQRAYAYLFHPPDQSITEEAHRRLEAIGEATDLGSGFQLALRDLEIRGAGSVLGEIQSGQISAVGFDLYAEMVADAIRQMEGTEPAQPEPSEVRIELPVVAHLPPEYLGDDEARLEAYRRLAEADTTAAVDDVAVEWQDRYGPPPEAALQLLDVARLRVEALRVGISEVVQLRHEVRLAPVDLTTSQEVRLQRLAPRAVLRPADRALFVPAPVPLVTGLVAFLTAMWPPDRPVVAQ